MNKTEFHLNVFKLPDQYLPEVSKDLAQVDLEGVRLRVGPEVPLADLVAHHLRDH